MDRGLSAPESAQEGNVLSQAKEHHVHSTWANTETCLPELFFQPESVSEVQQLVHLAGLKGRRVVTTGSAHSPSDITCTSAWLVNLDKLSRPLLVDAKLGIVTVEAGMRLYTLNELLEKNDLALPCLGSIEDQSVAGVISTGTHASSLQHGLMSDMVTALDLVLADGSVQHCSPEENPDLFRASLLGLGALGVIVRMTIQVVPAFRLAWSQVIDSDVNMISRWSTDLWTAGEFVRVWWFPHTRRAVIWSANRSQEPYHEPPTSYYDRSLGYYVYLNLLFLGHFIPFILPWVEWFVFGMQYGFKNKTLLEGCQPSRKALLMNCLYKQFVNEWALPLDKGVEALMRLGAWLNRLKPGDPGYVDPRIPFSAEGIWVHAPIEVRVSCQRPPEEENRRPFLDTSMRNGPTLHLNATLYRPYSCDPQCRYRYYEAFEWLMMELGGKPHWAKNFQVTGPQIERMFAMDGGRENGLHEWRRVRNRVDPRGMFVGPWHRRNVLEGPQLELEEVQR